MRPNKFLIVTSAAALTDVLLHVYYGYVGLSILLVVLLFLEVLIWALLGICWILEILQLRARTMRFGSLAWCILITGIVLIPGPHFESIGSILHIYGTDVGDLAAEARRVGQSYPEMTCFGSRGRPPCDDPLPLEVLPRAILNVRPSSVLVTDDRVFIAQFGLTGAFRGFVVILGNNDPWVSEPAFGRSECSICWKVRVLPGLYWYHSDPTKPPVFVPAE